MLGERVKSKSIHSKMIVALEITKVQSCIIRHVKRQFSSCFEVEEEIKVVVLPVSVCLNPTRPLD